MIPPIAVTFYILEIELLRVWNTRRNVPFTGWIIGDGILSLSDDLCVFHGSIGISTLKEIVSSTIGAVLYMPYIGPSNILRVS
jgi:hypothetical protein